MSTKYKYRNKNGRKQFYYVYTDRYGKTKTLTSYDEAVLDERVKEFLTESDQSSMPFGRYLENFLFKVQFADKRPSTKEKYRYDLRKIQKSEIGNIPINKLDDIAVQAYYNRLMDEKDSQSLIRNIHKLIRPCIRYAAARDNIKTDFMFLVKIPKESGKKRREKRIAKRNKVLTKEEDKKLFAYLEKVIRNPDTYREASQCVSHLLQLRAGPRVGETIALEWGDIIEDENGVWQLDINKTFYDVQEEQPDGSYATENEVGEPKSDMSYRLVPLPKKVADIIRCYKEKQRKMLEKVGIKLNDHTIVCSTLTGGYKDRHSLNKSLKRACAKAGINPHTTHDLRRTYATRCHEAGIPDQDLQELMGDSSLEVLRDHYIQISDDKQRINIQKLSDYLDEM